MTRFGTALLLLLAIGCGAALAQSGAAMSPLGASPDWSFDAQPQPVRKKKGAVQAPKPTPEESEKAARLAEARRKFFADKPDQKDDTIPEFGGYNGGSVGANGFKPGAQFRF